MVPGNRLRDWMVFSVVGWLVGWLVSFLLLFGWLVERTAVWPVLVTAEVPGSESRMLRVLLSVFSSVSPFKCLYGALKIKYATTNYGLSE
jgi:hypothetical protein